MKRFLARLTTFATLACVLFCCTYAINQRLMQADWFMVGEGTDTLILGDSHGVHALNPDRIPGSVNLCMLAEPYLITYLKLQAITRNNRGVKTILLSCSPHNLSSFNDFKFSREEWARPLFESYYPMLTPELLHEVPVDWRSYWAVSLKREVLPSKHFMLNLIRAWLGTGKKYYPYQGGHTRSAGTHSNPGIASERLRLHYFDEGRLLEPSKLYAGYLERMIEWCEASGLRLVLISTPLQEEYRNGVPWSHLEAFEMALARARERSDIQVLDLRTMELPRDCFLDPDHLNARGADQFSTEVERLIVR